MWFSQCRVRPGVSLQPWVCSFCQAMCCPQAAGANLCEKWETGGKMQRITIFTADGFLAEVPLSWPFLSFPVIIPYLRMKKLALCVAWYSNSCLQSVISSLSAPCYVRFTVLGQAKMFSVETANGISYSEWSSVGFKVAPKAVLSSFSSIISVCFQTGENECSES